MNLKLKDSIGYIRFVDDYLTFQHDEKDRGILNMIKTIHGKVEDVVVFGDDYNDLVMFRPEWTSIAMGNACDALKKKQTLLQKQVMMMELNMLVAIMDGYKRKPLHMMLTFEKIGITLNM